MNGADLGFINLGIVIKHLGRSISVFGFPIAYYGIIIGFGMLAGITVARNDAKRRGQDPELYLDFALYAILLAIAGARIYYVVFDWDAYKNQPLQIFNLRAGGLAIYGGVIAAVLTLIVYSKVKKVSFFSMADTAILGLITGQIIGRWGNFFNCEAFGGYTNNLFAMRIKRSLVNPSMISPELISHMIVDNGIEYIQVHPTFLYESLWNLALLCVMLWYRKKKRFDGEVLCLYMIGYGIGRFWIESLRTDQLIFLHTGIPVSQIVSAFMVLTGFLFLLYRRKSNQKKTNIPD